MKRMISAAILFFGLATVASAQTATGNASRTTGAVSSTKTKKAAKLSDSLNNGKEYEFSNGQQSTPTGAEATSSGIGGGFAAIGTDTTPKVVKPPTTSTTTKKTVTKRKSTAKGKG